MSNSILDLLVLVLVADIDVQATTTKTHAEAPADRLITRALRQLLLLFIVNFAARG